MRERDVIAGRRDGDVVAIGLRVYCCRLGHGDPDQLALARRHVVVHDLVMTSS
jgi:hypothetical protein